MNWICGQIGAREHYAVARALHRSRRLRALYTDFWAGRILRKMVAGRFRALAARSHPELGGGSEVEVISWNVRALVSEILSRANRESGAARSRRDQYLKFIETGRQFACAVRNDLRRKSSPASKGIYFTYDTGALETFEYLKECEGYCVLDQIDPSRVEMEVVREEEKRWPGWASATGDVPEQYIRRRESEWALADRIVVNSEFCREALVRQGVPVKKLVVIPLCWEGKRGIAIPLGRACDAGPLKVLWLGQVILRKGIQYLIEAARRLEGENIQFDIVGPVGISKDALASAPYNVKFHGRSSRDQTSGWYSQSHIFVFPTLSDGFGLTQLEAMAHGLPVIATPCCGSVVSHGVDGFIVPPRDVEALINALLRYAGDRELLRLHQDAALNKARQFDLASLGRNLLALEESLLR